MFKWKFNQWSFWYFRWQYENTITSKYNNHIHISFFRSTNRIHHHYGTVFFCIYHMYIHAAHTILNECIMCERMMSVGWLFGWVQCGCDMRDDKTRTHFSSIELYYGSMNGIYGWLNMSSVILITSSSSSIRWNFLRTDAQISYWARLCVNRTPRT